MQGKAEPGGGKGGGDVERNVELDGSPVVNRYSVTPLPVGFVELDAGNYSLWHGDRPSVGKTF